jgi:hypothetical protein
VAKTWEGDFQTLCRLSSNPFLEKAVGQNETSEDQYWEGWNNAGRLEIFPKRANRVGCPVRHGLLHFAPKQGLAMVTGVGIRNNNRARLMGYSTRIMLYTGGAIGWHPEIHGSLRKSSGRREA